MQKQIHTNNAVDVCISLCLQSVFKYFFVKYYSFGLNLFLVTWAGSKKLGFVRVSLFCLGKFSSGDPVGEEGSTGIDH